MQRRLLLCLLVFARCAACDSSSLTASYVRNVSGNALSTALDPNGGPPLVLGDLQLGAYDPNAILAGDTEARETKALDIANCFLVRGCTYIFTTLDFRSLPLGVLVRVGPPGATDGPSKNWMSTYTWAADGKGVRFALDQRRPIAATRSYALSTSAMEKVATIAGVHVDTLLNHGVLLGMVLGHPNEAGSSLLEPPPVPGATVSVDPNAPFDITYANHDLDGPNPASQTGSRGIFVVVARDPNVASSVWNVTPPPGDTVHHWTNPPTAGTFPGKITVLVLRAD